MQTAVALGTFDGLHEGHRAVLQQILEHPFPVAVTFDLPPKMNTENSALLMLPERKHAALQQLGVRQIHVLDFDRVENLSPQAFLCDLTTAFHPDRLVCGFNYRFGKNAAGDPAFLREYGAAHGIEVICVPPVLAENEPISSTVIRRQLADGEVEAANRQIFGGFCFSAPVIHGDARGRMLCFPTANQQYPALLAPLQYGVYAAEAEIDGKRLQGVCNIGIRPTFQTQTVFAETYLFDFEGDLYGKEMTLFPRRFLRPERRFDTLTDLKETLRRDEAAARAYFKGMF